MGLGFVLIAWLIGLLIAAIPLAFVIALAFWLWRRKSPAFSFEQVILAAALPFAWIFSAFAYFILYSIYCYAVRGVDPGIGDGWQVPITSHYYFCMIDETDSAFIAMDSCSGEQTVSSITKLARLRGNILAISDHSKAFLLNLATGKLKAYPDEKQMLEQFRTPPHWQSPNEFYLKLRYGIEDALALLVLFFIIALLSWLWYKWFLKKPHP